jgi:hypothetical protein
VSDFVFESARADDDEALRQLVASEPVPGAITIRYCREPSFFAASSLLATSWQVFVCRHRPSGGLAAVASRAVRRLFVNGAPTEVGYLGQLRIASGFQGRALLRQGFRSLRPLIDDGGVAGHVTTIIEGNGEARGLLVDHARPGLPRYREVGRLETLALAARELGARRPDGCALATGADVDLGEVVAFLNREGARRQFATHHSEADFGGERPATRDFALSELLVARRQGAIVGTLGLWDQSAFRQSVVQAYEGALATWRRALNCVAPLMGRPQLPAPGTRLRYGYACFGAIAGDDTAVFNWLVRLVLARARARGLECVLLGLDSRDPLRAIARQLRPVVYASRIYAVAWEEDALHRMLDARPTGLEVAAL